jgi:hypothetical protein
MIGISPNAQQRAWLAKLSAVRCLRHSEYLDPKSDARPTPDNVMDNAWVVPGRTRREVNKLVLELGCRRTSAFAHHVNFDLPDGRWVQVSEDPCQRLGGVLVTFQRAPGKP